MIGYELTVKNLIVLEKYEAAKNLIQTILHKFPNQNSLLALASDLAFASGDLEMYIRHEKNLITRLLQNDNPINININAESMKSQLKPEYKPTFVDQESKQLGTPKTKPDLFIIAGFSGCGKTTLMNSAFYDVEKIFSTRRNRIKIPSSEMRKFLETRRSLYDTDCQAMLFCNIFCSLEFINGKTSLPSQTILHLDLTDLLIRGRQMAFLDFKHLRLQDLALKSNVDDLFQRFLSIPLFDKFNSISIATIHQSFDTNQERYANRSRLKFDFDLSMQRIYHQALESWHQQISYSPIAIHNTVRELDGHYLIEPSK